jgi:hypothetical protein
MNFMTRRYLFTTLLLLPILGALAGCGGGAVRVEGKVTLDGAPVEVGGTISFFSGSGPGSDKGNAPIVGGKYVIAGERARNLTPGTYKVQILWNKLNDKAQARSSDPDSAPQQTTQVIPARYNTESTLTRELRPGTNKLDFELQTR